MDNKEKKKLAKKITPEEEDDAFRKILTALDERNLWLQYERPTTEPTDPAESTNSGKPSNS